jgi:hypothetical protein
LGDRDGVDALMLVRQRYSETRKCILSWYDDGTITKELAPPDPDWVGIEERFAYEAQVNELLVRTEPDLPFARLVGVERDGAAMRFRAVEGEPIGPKWGAELSRKTVEELLDIATRLEAFEPTEEWVVRYAPLEHPYLRLNEDVISPDEVDLMRRIVRSREWTFAFAHGDFIPRNVLSSPDGLVLIDWEFAGWYPRGFDRAFLWVVLRETPDVREMIEASVPDADRASFWLCACAVLLVHIGFHAPDSNSPYRDRLVAEKERALGALVSVTR